MTDKRQADTLLLEIESLKAQQPGAVYAELPEPITYQIAVLKACEHGDSLVGWRVEPSRQSFDASMRPKRKLYTEGDMHDFADRTHALRVAPHGQASAQAAPAAQGDALDAARYRFLRDGEWRDTDLEPFIRLQLNTLWDAKIDAARAAQEDKKP